MFEGETSYVVGADSMGCGPPKACVQGLGLLFAIFVNGCEVGGRLWWNARLG